MVELNKEKDNTVGAHELKDGQIGVIVRFSISATHEGTVVQRLGHEIVALGKCRGHVWPGLIEGGRPKEMRIRILEEGETLIIKNNQ